MQIPIKCAILALAAVSHRISVRPPNPPPTKKDAVIKGTLFEAFARSTGMISTIYVIGCLIVEIAVLLSLYFDKSLSSDIVSTFCPSGPPSKSSLSPMPPMFLLGVGTMVLSALIRLACYKALGILYTFEITIRPQHQLITWGPYSYVRHPGYTSAILDIVGTNLACFSAHSYINECHIMSTPAAWLVRSWFAFNLFMITSFLRRGWIEDAELRKVFGGKWDEYKRVVPCRFVPGLF